MLLALFVLALALPLDEPTFTDWEVDTEVDDFTDEVLRVTASAMSVERHPLSLTAFSITCKPTEGVYAHFTSGPEDFGRGFGRARWRVGKRPFGEGTWKRHTAYARKDLSEPKTHPLIVDIFKASESDFLIFEITAEDGDAHSGKVILTGARKAIQNVLVACGN